jgi:hypothetical protein
MSEQLAYLSRSDNRLELVYPEYGLRLRAAYAEWLFEAAAEIIRRIERTKTQGAIDELEMLSEFGEDEAGGVNMDILKYESGTRFETVPQCLVTLGDADYRWVSREARPADHNGIGERLHDTLMTRAAGAD